MTNGSATGAERTAWQQKIYDLQIELGIGAEEGLFCCEYFGECSDRSAGLGESEGRKGDWAYVGRRYGEASVGGKAARVLFVAMDRPSKGKEGEPSFLEYWRTQAEWMDGARYRGNPHMGGVDVELKYLVGDDEKDESRRQRRCQEFALVNSVFCGPIAARTASGEPLMRSRSSPTMKRNCRKHIRRLILALEPDIVIAQGNGPRDGLRRLLHDRVVIDSWTNGKEGQGHRSVELVSGQVEGGRPALFLLTGHPAFYPGFARKSGKLPDELERGLARAREEYTGMA